MFEFEKRGSCYIYVVEIVSVFHFIKLLFVSSHAHDRKKCCKFITSFLTLMFKIGMTKTA